jgi:hypothetical protein
MFVGRRLLEYQAAQERRHNVCGDVTWMCNKWGLTAFRFDFDKKHVYHEMALKRIEMIGKYNIAGRILLLPIIGNGDLNITLGKFCRSIDITFSYDCNVRSK